MPPFLELFPKRAIIFDDAIMDHHEPPGAVTMRMGVFFRRGAVSGPTGVAKTDPAVVAHFLHYFFKMKQLPHASVPVHFSVLDKSHTGGIISSVFEASQSFQENRHSLSFTDIPYNSAHNSSSIFSVFKCKLSVN
jgi:hypothetical protein